MATYDLIIRNGTIVDGTGAPAVTGDLAVRAGRIESVGELAGLSDSDAVEVIDATGLIVAPGIIDPHTHYDAQIHWDPYCTNSGWHGVTTVAVGNCGFGFMPCRAADRERYMKMMESTEQIPLEAMRKGLPWDWETFPEWVQHMGQVRKGINVAAYMPLNSLMIWVMGYEAAKSRPATKGERAKMRDMLNEAMDCGAIGFGFSFLQTTNSHKDVDGSPMPTDLMDIEEAYNLADVLRERGEGSIQALVDLPGGASNRAEVEELARRSGRPVLHTVIAAFDGAPQFHSEVLAWLDDVQAQGLEIYSQALALRAWNEFVLADFNHWQLFPIFNEFEMAGAEHGLDGKVAKALDPDFRTRLREFYSPELMVPVGGPLENLILVDACGSPRFSKHVGSTIGAIADAESAATTDVLMDLIADTRVMAEVKTKAATSVDPDKIAEVMRHPRVLAGTSDGGAHIKFWSGGQFGTDMIAWMTRDEGRFTLEEMHQKLSQFPAHVLGFADRGALLPGYAADIIVYDLNEIGYDQGSYDKVYDLPDGGWRRVAPARGYRKIIVNGRVTFSDNECSGQVPGHLLSLDTGRKTVVSTV